MRKLVSATTIGLNPPSSASSGTTGRLLWETGWNIWDTADIFSAVGVRTKGHWQRAVWKSPFKRTAWLIVQKIRNTSEEHSPQ